MVMRNHVDVVTATSAPALTDLSLPSDPTETVDVAPDAGRRIIVVARTKALGAQLAEDRNIDPVAIVTPRSYQAAYGVTADDIVWADHLTHEERADIEPHVLPATATAQTQPEAGE